jgi:Mrp family chromosome partitioning ATPase
MPQNEPTSPEPKVDISHVVAVMSGKGGVGKSTVACLLAAALQRRGFLVGILDADITGPSIPKMFGVHNLPPGIDSGILPAETETDIKIMSINLLLPKKDQPVVWRGPLIGRAIQQFWSDIKWGDLDFLIIDLPPGTADAALTVMQSLPLDGIVLITSPQDLAGMVVRKAGNMAIHLRIPIIGLVENMSYTFCPKCGELINLFGISQAERTAQMLGSQMLGRMPLDTQLSVMCDQGAIENYRNIEFEGVTDRVIQFASIKENEPSVGSRV